MFSDVAYISEMHEQYLPETYFPLVGQIQRFPRYKNKRIFDVQMRMFLDEKKIDCPSEWGLPTPNEEAAYMSLSKYAKPILWMTSQQVMGMNRAWEWCERQFYPYMGNSVVRSLDEVIGQLDMSTSSGAPFNVNFPTKRDLFNKCEDIVTWLEKDWELLAEDPYWTCLCTNSLKEEVRPAEKIVKNAIRTFTAMGVDATVPGNRLFADMNEKMNDSYLRTASAVGMSPYGGNWDQLFRKLAAFRKGFALDESQYDSSLRAYLMWGCGRLRWNMLASEFRTPANWRRIRTFYRNLVNTVIITPTGVLVMKTTGNPSGSPNTINDNTLILYVLMAYAWIMCNPNQTSYEEFEDNTAKVLVGDDNTWTVSDWAFEFYNARTVIEQWSTIGVTTTTDSLDPRLPEELDFLSAKTVFMQGQAVPVYDRKKLLTSLLYAPKEHMTPATTLSRTGALLTVGWTDIPFRKFCRDLIDWLLERYDKTLKDDQVWILAKCVILSDDRLFKLFMGRAETCYGQGFIRKIRKISKPYKITMQMSNQQNNQNPKGRKRGPRKPRAQRRGEVTRKNGGNSPKQNPGRRRRQPGRTLQGGVFRQNLTGRGSTRNQSNNSRTVIIDQDEFIGAVTVANQPNFNVTQFPVNPGNTTTFPWLSTIAARFEKYQFERLEFYYKREVSEFATNGQVGKVMMSFDADASDGAPTTKQQLEATRPHSDGMPSENISLIIPRNELKRLTSGFYVRPGLLPGAADIKNYDVGNLNVATQGIVNNVEVGELHVRYRVKLFLPVLEGTTAPTNNSVSWFQSSGAQTFTTTVATTSLNATANANGCNIVNTSGSMVPPVGNYLVDYYGLFSDSGTEAFVALNDFKKNGTTVHATANVIPRYDATTSSAADIFDVSGSVFVTANGTDAFTNTVTLTGAGGTLTGNTSVRWTAI